MHFYRNKFEWQFWVFSVSVKVYQCIEIGEICLNVIGMLFGALESRVQFSFRKKRDKDAGDILVICSFVFKREVFLVTLRLGLRDLFNL